MKMKMLLTVLGILLCSWPALALNTVYYVDQGLPGSDSNNGTSTATPFLTVTKCLNMINSHTDASGDACYVKNGTYTVTNITLNKSGSAGNPVIFSNYPGHSPILQPAATAWDLNGNVQIDFYAGTSPVSYWTIQGFEIRNYQYALHFEGVDHFIVQYNNIHDNGQGILGIKSWATTYQFNQVHHNGWTSGGTVPQNGAHNFYVGGADMLIYRNTIWGGAHANVQIDGIATTVPGVLYGGCKNCKIIQNTMAWAVIYDMVWWGGGGTAGDMSGSIITNNIFHGSPMCVKALNVGSSNSVAIDANICWNASPQYQSVEGSTVINYPSLSPDWTVTHNSTTNANMVNAPTSYIANPDFTLTASSTAAIDTGTILSGYTYNGVAPDRGYLEYGGAPPDTTPPAAPTGLTVQ